MYIVYSYNALFVFTRISMIDKLEWWSVLWVNIFTGRYEPVER